MAEGRCNCAGIKVTIPALPEQSGICYCSNCRRAAGSVGSVVYVLDKSDVSINDTNRYLKTYQDSDTKTGNSVFRQFCSNCGCPVASLLGEDSPKIILKGGLFEKISPPGFKAFEHEEPKWLRIAQVGDSL